MRPMSRTATCCTNCGAAEGLPHHDTENCPGVNPVVLEKYGISMLLCQPCLEGCKLIDLERSNTPEGLLARAARLQTEFWDALCELEAELGIEIDGTSDLEGMTVEDLREGE